MRKKKGQYAEKSRKFRERKAEQGKRLLRIWVVPEQEELVKWTLLSENFTHLRRIMERMKGEEKNETK